MKEKLGKKVYYFDKNDYLTEKTMKKGKYWCRVCDVYYNINNKDYNKDIDKSLCPNCKKRLLKLKNDKHKNYV